MTLSRMLTAIMVVTLLTLGTNVQADIVHHYSFDALTTGGDVADDVGSATGVWNGDAGANNAVAGFIGAGASATNDEDGGNGEEHYTIASLNGIDGATGLTISLWFNQDVNEENNNSTYNGLFMTRNVTSVSGGGGENWGVALEGNSAPRHIDWRMDGVPGTEFNDIPLTSAWHHVVMTYDAGTEMRSLYFDGTKLITEASPSLGNIVTGSSWDIGNDTCCGNREYTGTLDDIGIFNNAISDAQALQIYNGGLSGLNVVQALAVPEPGSLAVLGMFGLAAFMRRKR